MENTYSWTCKDEIGTTIPQYANDQGITYEAARRQVVKYLDNELQGHIRVRNNTKYLDDFAIEFLNEHRRPQAQWSNPDTTEFRNALKSYLVNALKENLGSSSGELTLHSPRSESAAKNQAAEETTQEPNPSLQKQHIIEISSEDILKRLESLQKSRANESSPVDSSAESSLEQQLTALKVENDFLKKQLADMQAAYNKLLADTSSLSAKIYYAEKNAENAEKNSKRWYNLALECIRTFSQQPQDAAASESTDGNPSED